METTLSVHKSAELIKLGIDQGYATGAGGDCPVFTLSDLMSLVPQWIFWCEMPLWLHVRVDGTDWQVGYLSAEGVDEAMTSVRDYELVEALYEALRRLLSRGLIRA